MALFPDPAADAARLKQLQIRFNQNVAGNEFHSKEAFGLIEKDYAKIRAQKFYSEKVFNAKIKIQGKVNKGLEDMARRLAAAPVNEGGKSRSFGDNIGLMAASKISQMEQMSRKVQGEIASAYTNTGAIKLASDYAKINSKTAMGPGAKMGVKFRPTSQVLSAVKLGASIATKDFGGAFGQLSGGGNANMFEWMSGQSVEESKWSGLGGTA
tara:strand:+ start:27 stop:659 length:633 start_codon:yes stop_codon:yes gene_type:complete